MRRGAYTLAGFCVLVVIALAFVPAVHADSTPTETNSSEPSYQIIQDQQVIPVEPIEGDEPVEEFYDYRNPEVGDRDHPFWGRSFSSEGTVEYQQDDASILMLYDGPEGVSLVAVHDRLHEDQDDATTGGSVSWELSGLPEDGEWAVIDDDYGWLTDEEDKDDIFYLDDDHQTGAAGNDGEPPSDVDAMMSWVWLTGRTDGMAFRGLGSEPSISIDPAFNEESYHRYGDQRRADERPDRPGMGERYNGSIDEWQVIVPTSNGDGDFERVPLESLEEPVEIRSTETEPDEQTPAVTVESISLNRSTIETGEEAELTVVLENNGGVDGDYTVGFEVAGTMLQSETVTVPQNDQATIEFTQQFTSSGVYELSVGGHQTTLSVEDPETAEQTDSTDGDTDSTTAEEIPGFGPTSAVVALLVAVLLTRAHLDSTE